MHVDICFLSVKRAGAHANLCLKTVWGLWWRNSDSWAFWICEFLRKRSRSCSLTRPRWEPDHLSTLRSEKSLLGCFVPRWWSGTSQVATWMSTCQAANMLQRLYVVLSCFVWCQGLDKASLWVLNSGIARGYKCEELLGDILAQNFEGSFDLSSGDKSIGKDSKRLNV